MKKFLSLCLVIFAVHSLKADPQLFTYRIEAWPQKGGNCEETAKQFATRFSELTGISTAKGYCRIESKNLVDVDIVYTAETRVNPVSTVAFVKGVPKSHQGSYDTNIQCESELADQLALFKFSTGLEALVSYCYQDSSAFENGWVLRIDGFGNAKPLRLQVYEEALNGSTLEKISELQTVFQKYAKSKLTQLSSVSLPSYFGERAVRLVLYSQNPLSIRTQMIGKFASAETCNQNQSQLRKDVTEKGELSPIFCVYDRVTEQYKLFLFLIRKDLWLESMVHSAYENLAACENDKAAAMKEMSKNTGFEAITSVCSPDGSRTRMDIVLKMYWKLPPN